MLYLEPLIELRLILPLLYSTLYYPEITEQLLQLICLCVSNCCSQGFSDEMTNLLEKLRLIHLMLYMMSII